MKEDIKIIHSILEGIKSSGLSSAEEVCINRKSLTRDNKLFNELLNKGLADKDRIK